IMNVAKKLNLSGYSELVFRIIEAHHQQNSREKEYVTEEELETFHQLLARHQDSTCVLVSTGFSQPIADYMNDTFNFHFIRSLRTAYPQLLQGQALQKILLIFVSHSGEEKELNE